MSRTAAVSTRPAKKAALAIGGCALAAMVALGTAHSSMATGNSTSVAVKDTGSYSGSFAPTSTNDLMTPMTPPPGSPYRD